MSKVTESSCGTTLQGHLCPPAPLGNQAGIAIKGWTDLLLAQARRELLNDMSKRLLSPTELKKNCVLLTQKTPVRYEKLGNTAFFLALHSYKDVVLIFISVSHYLMLLFEHVTETIQSSAAFCH